MVYETNCTEITQDKWRELMKYGRKCSYRMLAARIKRELPELYHALALQFYNPYAEQCRQTPTHYILIRPLNILSENNKGQMVMKTKKVDKKKTLAYAVAFYFTEASIKFMMGNTMYEYVHTVYDRRYDNGVFNTLAVVYNYKKMKYEVLVVSDEKVGDKEIQII